MKSTSSRAALIAKRDFMSKDIDESDDDESGGESYDINAGHMYQSVTFDIGRSKQQHHVADSKNDTHPRHKKSSKTHGRRAPQEEGGGPLEELGCVASIGKNPTSLAALDYKPVGNNKKDPLKKNVKDNRTMLSSIDGRPLVDVSEEELALQRTVLFRQQEEDKLLKEKEEMRLMMEEIKREKMELYEMNKLKDKDKQNEKEMALREREELRIALENMRNQNKMLQHQMKQTSEDAKVEIENERRQRAKEVSEIEHQNRQLTEQVLAQQAEAERKLAAERDELRVALRRMEDDKLALTTRIFETERASKQEAEDIEKQRLAFANSLKDMENEKYSLQKKVHDNEEKARNASDAMASQLAREKEELERKLQLMDSEKNELSEALMAKEEAALAHAKALALQLEAEKTALQESTLRMEQEKVELAKALAAAESEAKKQASVVSAQLKKEQDMLEDTKTIMRCEQEALEAKLKKHQEDALKSNAVVTEEMLREKQALEGHLAAMKREKEEMAAAWRKAAEETQSREQEAVLRMAKERDELREAVERMKAEMELEKRRSEQALAARDASSFSSAGGAVGGKSKSTGKLTASSTKSLYNILEESEEDGREARPESGKRSHKSSKKNLTGGSKRSLARMVIKERDEEEVIKSLEKEDDDDHDYDDFVDDVCEDEYGEDSEDSEGEGEDSDEFDQLPAPHAAAAKGDVEHLRRLGKMDSSLLTSVDGSGRCPLFYAMAYDNVEVVKYVLEAAPTCAQQTDMHGDTPLHAGCSSGSSEAVSVLLAFLSDIGEDVNVANSMGMSPMHLAQNAEVMSALYAANADLKAVDNSNRSPLFVAAAMNRVPCVEFLLDCLGGDDEAVYMIDSRGDTALHAAACNGASESLLLLLQCGITPLMTNNKGLKAIDLAQKNKQKKCREILAQYHLHFATTSDFDSVLFIATLEGHKKIRESLQRSLTSEDETDGDGTYNIIKKQFAAGARDAASDDQMKDKVKNLFSLNSNKSLRLKRYGSWIAYEDQSSTAETTDIYWYNHSSGVGQWEVPESVVPLIGKSGSLKSKSSSKQMMRISSKQSMRLKRVGDWIQYCTEAGQTFYYNDKNGDFQWTNPTNDKGEGDAAGGTAPAMMEQAKDEEWVAYKDPDSGCVFWYNQKTHVSQWDCPLEPGSEGYVDQDGNAADNYAADLVEVHHDDDLGI